MSKPPAKGRVEFDLPTEDAMIAFWMAWLALGEALRMLGELQGNSGWREELYDRTHRMLEDIDKTTIGDPTLFKEVNTDSRAFRNGSKAIDAAFDRIKFT